MRVELGEGELKFHSPEEAASEICASRRTGPVKISGEAWHGPHNHARCVMGEPQGGAFILLLLAVSVTYGGRGGFNLLTMDKKFDILKEFCRCN